MVFEKGVLTGLRRFDGTQQKGWKGHGTGAYVVSKPFFSPEVVPVA